MNRWHDVAWLFAERSGVDRSAGRAQSESGQLIAIMVGMAVVVLIVWLLSSLSDRRRRHVVVYRSPWRLFLAVAKSHRLSWRDTWLLWRLAHWHDLKDPARLFLEPERFEREGLSRRLVRRASRLESLRARLFAGLVDQQSQAAAPPASSSVDLPISMPAAAEPSLTDLVEV